MQMARYFWLDISNQSQIWSRLDDPCLSAINSNALKLDLERIVSTSANGRKHIYRACYQEQLWVLASFVTGSAKNGLITHDRGLNFSTNTKAHQYTIKFHYQNEVVLSGLLLLASFSQPIGNTYDWSWSYYRWSKVEDCV